jgi:hypothetical protein
MKTAETYDSRVRCMRKELLVMPRIGGIFGGGYRIGLREPLHIPKEVFSVETIRF